MRILDPRDDDVCKLVMVEWVLMLMFIETMYVI